MLHGGDPARYYMLRLAKDEFMGGLSDAERRIWGSFWRHQHDAGFVHEVWKELGDVPRQEIETTLRSLYQRWSRIRREHGL